MEAEENECLTRERPSTLSITEQIKIERKRKQLENMQCQMRVCTILLVLNLMYMALRDISSFTSLSIFSTPSSEHEVSHSMTATKHPNHASHTKRISDNPNPEIQDLTFSNARSSADGFAVSVEVKDKEAAEPGVFAKEFITKGQTIWSSTESGYNFEDADNRKLKEFLIGLSEKELMYFLTKAYISNGVIRLTNTMFDYIQHDIDSANVIQSDDEADQIIALRDIQPGEELLQNHLMRASGPIWWEKMVLRARSSCEHFLHYFAESHQTWGRHCEFHIFKNETWTSAEGKYLDRVSLKEELEKMGTSMRIPKTYSVIAKPDASSSTLSTLLESSILPENYVALMNHYSGGVATILGDELKCRTCQWTNPRIKTKSVSYKLLTHMKYYFGRDYNPLGFQEGSDAMVFEEYLGQFTEYGFYVSRGVVLYAETRCAKKEWSYFNADFESLRLTVRPFIPCETILTKPGNWDMMVSIASAVGAAISEVIRIDLGTDNKEVYFKHLTLVPGSCKDNVKPTTLPKLMLWIQQNPNLSHRVTPDVVKCLVDDALKLDEAADS